MVETTTRRTGALLKAGAVAVVVSVVLNHFLQAGALALFEIPHDFSPLHGPGPVLFFSVIGAVTGVGVFAGIAVCPPVLFRCFGSWRESCLSSRSSLTCGC